MRGGIISLTLRGGPYARSKAMDRNRSNPGQRSDAAADASARRNAKAVKSAYVPTCGEEVANTVSHGVMALAMLFALPYVAVRAYVHDPQPMPAACAESVFVISVFLMLLCSTLYHAMKPASGHKRVFHILDHIFIYVAIAGTYTPVALLVIGSWQGVLITVLQWAAVVGGIFYKSLCMRSVPAVSLTIYLVMGWTLVFFLPLFLRNATVPLLVLVAAGGVFYTLGAWVYARKGFRYHHLVWHVAIILGLLSHFIGIVFFIR